MKAHRIAIATVLSTAALAATASAALALPPPGGDPIGCPTGFHRVGDTCVRNPVYHSPAVSLTLARQTTDLTGIPVTGSATDADQASAALTVKISVDGALVQTVTANQPDPQVATPYAAGVTPPGHSFDVIVPASQGAQNLCVTAVSVGGGSDTTRCTPVDSVREFDGYSISYDLAHLQITDTSLDELDKVSNTNNTAVQQSTTISGTKTVSDVQGWSNTYGLTVSVSAKVGIPLIGDTTVTVGGSASWVKNGSTTTTNTFTWSQPVLVPAHSRVDATVAVTKSTLTVPYTLSGYYVYNSGAAVAGTNSGTYTGVNSHDLQVTLTQLNLDGTLAAKPVAQPKATLLKQKLG
jgi:hypothetical protein